MKNIIQKFTVSTGLLASCVLSIGASAQVNQGHHQSGIIGQVEGLPTSIHQCHIRILSSDGGKVDTDIITDLNLTFGVALKPGVYTLVPYVVNTPPPFIPAGSPVVVEVEKKEMQEMTLLYVPYTVGDWEFNGYSFAGALVATGVVRLTNSMSMTQTFGTWVFAAVPNGTNTWRLPCSQGEASGGTWGSNRFSVSLNGCRFAEGVYALEGTLIGDTYSGTWFEEGVIARPIGTFIARKNSR